MLTLPKALDGCPDDIRDIAEFALHVMVPLACTDDVEPGGFFEKAFTCAIWTLTWVGRRNLSKTPYQGIFSTPCASCRGLLWINVLGGRWNCAACEMKGEAVDLPRHYDDSDMADSQAAWDTFKLAMSHIVAEMGKEQGERFHDIKTRRQA